MRHHLEAICLQVNAVLFLHGLLVKVAGGYLADNGLLLSLSDTVFVDEDVIEGEIVKPNNMFGIEALMIIHEKEITDDNNN